MKLPHVARDCRRPQPESTLKLHPYNEKLHVIMKEKIFKVEVAETA